MIRSLSIVAALTIAATSASSLSAQETGRVIGQVLNAVSSAPVSGAQVFIEDTGTGTLTDLNGRFVLQNVPVGTVSVTVQSLGYARKTVTDVAVTANGITPLNISLEETTVDIEGITVSASAERGSVAAVLDARRTSASMLEAVGATEISRRPDSDAADVAKRMTGVTVAEGKFVFVRGLGQRYSQTSLNGSSLPSPQPEREVVPLDLFPSGFLESLSTQKSYTPDLPADFSGGSVQIETKDFPDRFTLRAGVSSSFNSESQFQDGYLNYVGGGTDWLGVDDGTRAQTDAIERIMGPVTSGNRLPSDPDQLVEIGQSLQALNRPFTPLSGDTPLNRSFNVSVGGSFLLDEDDGKELGYFLAGTYSDNYTQIRNEFERKWRISAFDPSIEPELRQPNVDYNFRRGNRATSWGTVGNLTYKFSPTQKISLRTTANLSTDDEARTYEGLNLEDLGGLLRSDRLRYQQRLLLWSQLEGEHQLFGEQRVEWRMTAARADREEPMMQEALYLADFDDEDYVLLTGGESGRYLWTDLVEDDLSGAFDWTVPFDLGNNASSIKFGAAYRERTRDFAARRILWDFVPEVYTDIDEALEGSEIVPVVRGFDQFGLRDVIEPGDLYDALDQRAAGYLMFDLGVTRSLQAIFGARVEQYDLSLNSRGEELSTISQTDFAPSINLIYSIGDQVKVRAAGSRTVDRPEFREVAPFQFTEAASLRQLFGNENLTPAEIISGDLRLDYFPSAGEILSAGVFFKQMDDPIEQVFIAAASSAYSFQNAEDARVFGVELDAQIRGGRLADALDNFAFAANYSWIESEVNVRPEGIFFPTNLTRPLEGQATYVFNSSVNYVNGSGIEAGVFYNRFGDRLFAAGGAGIPDIYEKPRNALDASLGFPLPGGVSARIRGTNLLDAAFLWEQESNGIIQEQRRFNVGRTFSVGLTWEY